ncbi:MAG: mandelate racemase/muconate lactonizing enzyme family protein [Acidimicrobiales bacterium]
MKVELVTTTLVEVPLAKPILTAIHSIQSVGCVLVEVRSADGVTGQSYVFTINGDRLRAFDEMVVGLSRFLLGHEAHAIEALWHRLWAEVNPTGHKGVTVSAMSALDVACWDLVGRTLDMPLHHLWGSCRSEVSAYASSGLWLSQSIGELQAQAKAFVDHGFTAVKVRLGSDRISDDVARVRAVRDVVGPAVEVLVDANQKFTPKHAIRLGRALEEFSIGWFEEPVSALDLAGHARVRDALDVPIASGETEYTRFGMQSMLDAGAADVLMPDLQRIGGYSEFKKASATASSQHIPVSSHYFTEHSLCLAGSLHNCISVEHTDWFAPLFTESVELNDGNLAIPDRPGHGFTFAPDAIERFAI